MRLTGFALCEMILSVKQDELTRLLEIQSPAHYEMKSIDAVLIRSELYTTLGKRLYDLYGRYNISRDDQREIEALAHVLMTFTMSRHQAPKSVFERIRSRLLGR
jgi:hypothetical protein